MGTKILDEDGLLELIRTKPGKKSKYEIAAEAEVGAHTILSSVKLYFFFSLWGKKHKCFIKVLQVVLLLLLCFFPSLY